MARQTRNRFLRCCGVPTLVIGSHFADPTGGWVIPARDFTHLRGRAAGRPGSWPPTPILRTPAFPLGPITSRLKADYSSRHAPDE
jgi:hypothetical protein